MVLTSSRAGNLYFKPIFPGRGGRDLFYTLCQSDFYGSYGETTARKDPEGEAVGMQVRRSAVGLPRQGSGGCGLVGGRGLGPGCSTPFYTVLYFPPLRF